MERERINVIKAEQMPGQVRRYWLYFRVKSSGSAALLTGIMVPSLNYQSSARIATGHNPDRSDWRASLISPANHSYAMPSNAPLPHATAMPRFSAAPDIPHFRRFRLSRHIASLPEPDDWRRRSAFLRSSFRQPVSPLLPTRIEYKSGQARPS